MKKGMNTTVDFVPWDSLGNAATPDDLYPLHDAVKVAAEQDKDIEEYDIAIFKDQDGAPSILRVTVTGKTRADVLVERAILKTPKKLVALPIRGETDHTRVDASPHQEHSMNSDKPTAITTAIEDYRRARDAFDEAESDECLDQAIEALDAADSLVRACEPATAHASTARVGEPSLPLKGMSSKTADLVEIHSRTYEAWKTLTRAAKAAEYVVGRGENYDEGYDELITACSTFGSLAITAYRAAVAALEIEVLNAAESDAELAALIDAKGTEIDEAAKKVGDGYFTMSEEALRSAAAYDMSCEFVELKAGTPPRE